jgi:hypothetical protein
MPSYTYRKKRREAVLRKMATWRAAKERKRLACGPVKDEPRMEKYYPFEIGIRVKATGDFAFTDLKSARFAQRLASNLIQHFYP